MCFLMNKSLRVSTPTKVHHIAMVPYLTVTVLVVGLAFVAGQGEVESTVSPSSGYNRSPSRTIIFPRVSQPIYRIPRPKPSPTLVRPLETVQPVQPVSENETPSETLVRKPSETDRPADNLTIESNVNDKEPQQPISVIVEQATSALPSPTEAPETSTALPEYTNRLRPRRPVFSVRPTSMPKEDDIQSTSVQPEIPSSTVVNSFRRDQLIPNQRRPIFSARPIPKPTSFGVIATQTPNSPPSTDVNSVTKPESPSVIATKEIPNQRRPRVLARPVPRPITVGVMLTPQPDPRQETGISALKDPIPPSEAAPVQIPETSSVSGDIQPEGATDKPEPEPPTAIPAEPEITTVAPTLLPEEDTSLDFANPSTRGGLRSPRPTYSAPPPSGPATPAGTVPTEVSKPIPSTPVIQEPYDPQPDIISAPENPRRGYLIPNQQKPYIPSKIISFPKPIPNRPPPGIPTGPVTNVPMGPRPTTKPKLETPVSSVPNPILLNYRCSSENGYFAKSDCDSYIECKKNVAIEYTCPDGLHFNPNAIWPEYACAYPSEVKCQGTFEQPPKPTSECPRQYGFFEAPSDCSRYISCQEGAATLMNCPPGLVFNPTVSSCDWPEQVPSCDAKVFRGFTCPEAPLDEFGNPWDIIMNYKYSNSCKNYVACQRGKPRLLSCDSGFSFDSEAGYCVESDYVEGCAENY